MAVFLAGDIWGFSQQKLETPQETNDRIGQLAAALHTRQGDYVVGSGDLLRIDVFDVPELSRDVRVNQSGFVSLPLLPGKVRANGLTAFQLEEKLGELLQANGLVSRPQVTVSVKEQNSQPIMVVGAVNRPIAHQAVRQSTLLEVLAAAGGIANEAGSTVIVTRPRSQRAGSETEDSGESPGGVPAPPQTIPINLGDLLDSGDSRFNIPLLPGDVVSVPRAGIVYVVGAVERPGGFVLQNDRDEVTALKILALAGGFKAGAKPEKALILRKNRDTAQTRELGVDLRKLMARKSEDIRLFPNDILFVPASAGKMAARRAGEIALGVATGVTIFRLSR